MTGKAAKVVGGRTDWAALRSLPEDEIERIAAEDEDNPATDETHWAEASLGLPLDEASPPAKTSIHASFDRDVVDFFRSGGRGYQTRMNAVLRRYMESARGKKADR